MSEQVECELRSLESRRCAAIRAGDVEGLAAMLSDDYVHVHMNGALDDRSGHLDAIATRPRTVERGAIAIRVYGDVAVMTGEQINHMQQGRVRAYCQQVALHKDGEWRFVSCQLTPIATPR